MPVVKKVNRLNINGDKPLDPAGTGESSPSPQKTSNVVRPTNLIGQPGAIDRIFDMVDVYRAGLAPDGRPPGVFMLLGPTGTGKTHTVELVAEALHKDRRLMLQINCGELHSDHEVAKLIGAPPGYLGHRETSALLSQLALSRMQSEHSGATILLFDELEKAAPAALRMMLGILDKGQLRTGDNNTVYFKDCFIFFTSNIGAQEMARELEQPLGLPAPMHGDRREAIARIGNAALRRRFSPEFLNRIDHFINYNPLTRCDLNDILDVQIDELQQHFDKKLPNQHIDLVVTTTAREWLLDHGEPNRYGARELRRLIARHILQPVAALIVQERIAYPARLKVHVVGDMIRVEPVALKLSDAKEN